VPAFEIEALFGSYGDDVEWVERCVESCFGAAIFESVN
jgi:hypothetical protein